MMKVVKLFLDRYFFTKIEKYNPNLYRFLTYDLYKNLYSPIANKLKYGDKYFFHSVSIETSTYCNRKCDYCPNKDNVTPENYIDKNIFYEAIRQLKEIKFSGIFEYCFYNEPLFNKNLAELVSYAKRELPNCIHSLTSNGDLLTIEKAKELVDAGIDKFIVTIHDKNPDKAYKRLKPVKEFLKEKMRLQTVYDLALQNRGGEIDISKYEYVPPKKCPNILKLMIVLNGDVVLCCNDYHKKHVMGNIMKTKIVDIWNSYDKLRKELLDKNIAKLDICKKCLERE